MKKFFIFLVFLVAFMIWFEDWTSSGKMDTFLENNEMGLTPRILYVIAESCFTAQESRAANHYYRWVVEKYPNEEFIPRARFHLAETYSDLGDRVRANEQYVVLKDSFTSTHYGQIAKRRWEMARF